MIDDNSPAVGRTGNADDLRKIKAKVHAETALRDDRYRACVTVHMGTCGIASGARGVLGAVMDELEACGRADIRVTTSGCIGACSHEPAMTVEVLSAEPVLYGGLDAASAGQVFREHVLAGKLLTPFVVTIGPDSSFAGGNQ